MEQYYKSSAWYAAVGSIDGSHGISLIKSRFHRRKDIHYSYSVYHGIQRRADPIVFSYNADPSSDGYHLVNDIAGSGRCIQPGYSKEFSPFYSPESGRGSQNRRGQ